MPDDKDVSVNEIYKEQYAHFRAMNDILYKIPPLFAVAIGGLWYFAASQLKSDRLIAVGVFLFAAVVSVCSVFIMARFSLAFSRYIGNLNKLDGDYAVSLRDMTWPPSTVKIIQFLLWAATVISLAGVVYAVVLLFYPPLPS
ncbi:hypothetical protein EOD10_32510 [Mesorhizobium sp. M7A.T.Ca.TU.009.01.3.2]|nr:hypothetical protein EOD10_32510 [Mesorhizobium sp. M7A.T.Ca.TU.009.01.3.2]RUV12917.1 hypothetical protein EOD00_05760 [Mesorhizobium sp. M7A.T.Ca.TU.009.01.3.1]